MGRSTEQSDHGVVGTRGATSCGDFHEFSPGPDGFCNCCRPPPGHPVVKRAEAWVKKKLGKSPERGSKGRAGLDAWQAAGRP